MSFWVSVVSMVVLLSLISCIYRGYICLKSLAILLISGYNGSIELEEQDLDSVSYKKKL